MTTHSKPTAKRAALRLPTLKTFLRWPIEKRAIFFGRWLAAQPRYRRLHYWLTMECPFACFGCAITRGGECFGGGADFDLYEGVSSHVVRVSFRQGDSSPRSMALWKALHDSATYGQAADAYAALKLPLS